MASSIEFLKHPAKLFSSLFEAPPDIVVDANKLTESAPVVLSQVTAPEGMCGWIPSEVGSPDWVCQAFGQVMPGIVFFVSMVVVTLTTFFLVWYYLKSKRAIAELKNLLKNLSGESKASHNILATLRDSGKRLPAIHLFVVKIESLLIKTDNREIILSKSVSDIAQNNQSIDYWPGKRLADEIPSWLTTLGLLTTFIAILLGLQHVKVMSNLEVQGIGGLVNGLSGKFFSSIVALSCALSVTIVNYFLSEKKNQLWQNVVSRLEILLPHLTTEQMLLDFMTEQIKKKNGS